MINLTIRQAVDLRGGLNKVAEEHGVTPKAVSNWQVWNRLPLKDYYPFAKAMEDIGYPDFDPRNPAPLPVEPEDRCAEGRVDAA